MPKLYRSAASTSGGGCATVKLLSQGEENKGFDPRQAIFFLALMFLPIFLTQRWRRHPVVMDGAYRLLKLAGGLV